MLQNNDNSKIHFKDEIRQQPQALSRFVQNAFEGNCSLLDIVQGKKNLHIVLTGMGSSLFACYITEKYLQNKGIHVSVMETYELVAMNESFFTDDMIIIAVSQSGESPEVVELLKKLPRNISVVGVTNYVNSHLSEMAHIVNFIYAGIEYLTSTKTYTNTLAAMLLLSYRIGLCSEEELDVLHSQLEQCVKKMENIISDETIGKKIAGFIADIKYLICVGSGYSYTTACHSEIIAEEAGKFYASRFTPAQFIHGPIELISDGFGIVIYDFDRKYSEKCDEVRKNVLAFGGKVLLITNRADIVEGQNQMVYIINHDDPATATLLEILPLELGIDELCKARGTAAGELSRVVKRIVR